MFPFPTLFKANLMWSQKDLLTAIFDLLTQVIPCPTVRFTHMAKRLDLEIVDQVVLLNVEAWLMSAGE